MFNRLYAPAIHRLFRLPIRTDAVNNYDFFWPVLPTKVPTNLPTRCPPTHRKASRGREEDSVEIGKLNLDWK